MRDIGGWCFGRLLRRSRADAGLHLRFELIHALERFRDYHGLLQRENALGLRELRDLYEDADGFPECFDLCHRRLYADDLRQRATSMPTVADMREMLLNLTVGMYGDSALEM